MHELISAFHDQPVIKLKNTNYIVNPLLDHSPETPFSLMRSAVEELAQLTDYKLADKIVAEEDRGGYLAALVAYYCQKSLSMVKWNPLELEGQISVDFRNAYTTGKMYLYGVKPGDKVILIEDLVDSGGTIIAMIELLRKAEVDLVDVICLAEKEEMQGVARIKKATGIDVKYLLRFNCQAERSRVTEFKGRPHLT